MKAWALMLAATAGLGLVAAIRHARRTKPVDLKISLWVPPVHPSSSPPGMGRLLGEEGLRRLDQDDRSSRPSSSARPSTITTWRGTASPTSPTSIRATSRAGSRSSRSARSPSPSLGRPQGHAGSRRLVPRLRGDRNEGHEVLPRDDPFAGTLHSRRKITIPSELKGVKVRPAQIDHRPARLDGGRHERPELGPRSPRHAGAGRRGRDLLPLGLGLPVRGSTRSSATISTSRSTRPSSSTR